MPSSHRKLAGDLTPGDYVWRSGRYWLVVKTTPITSADSNDAGTGTGTSDSAPHSGGDSATDHSCRRPDYGPDLLIHLRHTRDKSTTVLWPYRANLDVAVHPTTPDP